MIKKKPYIVNVSWNTEIDVLSFGTNKLDAEHNVRKDVNSPSDVGLLTDTNFEQSIFIKHKVISVEDIPTYIFENGQVIDGSCIFGISDGESIIDYFKEDAKEEALRKLDERHLHFPFWDDVKKQ